MAMIPPFVVFVLFVVNTNRRPMPPSRGRSLYKADMRPDPPSRTRTLSSRTPRSGGGICSRKRAFRVVAERRPGLISPGDEAGVTDRNGSALCDALSFLLQKIWQFGGVENMVV